MVLGIRNKTLARKILRFQYLLKKIINYFNEYYRCVSVNRINGV